MTGPGSDSCVCMVSDNMLLQEELLPEFTPNSKLLNGSEKSRAVHKIFTAVV